MRRIAMLLVLTALAGVAAAQAGAASLLVVHGRGWGHGIGMSQYGAQGFAAGGWDHRRILAHYYPGTTLSSVAPTTVRVLVADARIVAVRSEAPFAAHGADGEVRELAVGTRFGRGLQGLAGPVRIVPGEAPLRVNGTAYRGEVVLHLAGKSVLAVNRLPLRHYLYGVVPREMPTAWSSEALKAQAVAARSYALATRKTGKPYDMYDDVRSQVYGGLAAEDWRASAAVDATAGEVLTFDGRVASTFFFSTSGGKTASIADEWGTDPVPYLVSRPDPHDVISPHHRWGPVAFTGNQVRKRIGMLLDDVRLRRNGSGRVATVVAERRSIVRELSGAAMRKRFGLRSTWFSLALLSLEAKPNAAPGPAVVLEGRLRGVRKATLEQRPAGGAWEAVKVVKGGEGGRFRLRRTPAVTTTYRLAAAGEAGAAVRVVVRARAVSAVGRPAAAPGTIPRWAWAVLRWQLTPPAERGARPAAPRRLPAWYWEWKRWRVGG